MRLFVEGHWLETLTSSYNYEPTWRDLQLSDQLDPFSETLSASKIGHLSSLSIRGMTVSRITSLDSSSCSSWSYVFLRLSGTLASEWQNTNRPMSECNELKSKVSSRLFIYREKSSDTS